MILAFLLIAPLPHSSFTVRTPVVHKPGYAVVDVTFPRAVADVTVYLDGPGDATEMGTVKGAGRFFRVKVPVFRGDPAGTWYAGSAVGWDGPRMVQVSPANIESLKVVR